MKSKTSFFNFALLKKNTIRFSPLWILYSIFWVVAMPLMLGMQLSNQTYPLSVEDTSYAIGTMLTVLGPAIACVCGVAMAMAVFSYLYNARSVSMMHSLPIRRSTLYLTNYISGLLFMVVPNLVVALLTAAVSLAGGVFCPGMICTWFLGVSAMELFFYSFAVFCAMFTGHLLALPLFYGILNILCIALYSTIQAFIAPFLYGFKFGSNFSDEAVLWFSPMFKLHSVVRVSEIYNSEYTAVTGTVIGGTGALAVYACAGVVFAVLAYAAYHRRRSEAAGDIVAVGWAKVVFRYGVGITAAFTIGQGLYYLVFSNSALRGSAMELVCMIVVGALGFFVAQMLLHKSFRVLRRSVRGSVICAAVVLIVFAAASLDLTGYINRVPQADRVQQVQVEVGAYGYAEATLEGDDAVEQVLALHHYVLEHRREIQNQADWNGYYGDEYNSVYVNFRLNYTLTDGTTLSRSYNFWVQESDLDDPASGASLLQNLLNNTEFRADYYLGALTQNADDDKAAVVITGGMLTYYEAGEYDVEQERTLSTAEAQTLRDALLEDAAANRLDTPLLFGETEEYTRTHYVNTLCITYRADSADENYQYISLTSHMTSTLQALEDLGIVGEHITLRTEEEQRQGLENGTYVVPETEASGPVFVPAEETAEEAA